jgi:hypothetical protein
LSGCKAQHHFVEVLVEFLRGDGIGFRQDGEVVPLLDRGRRDVQMALAPEDRARDFAVDRGVEGEVAALKGEDGRVALESEVLDGDGIAARQHLAQLLIGGVRIGRALRKKRLHRDCCKRKKGEKRQRDA